MVKERLGTPVLGSQEPHLICSEASRIGQYEAKTTCECTKSSLSTTLIRDKNNLK